MPDIWELLNNYPELVAKAKNVISSLEATDARLLAPVVAILIILSSRMVGGQPVIRRLGLRLAAATFLVYGGYACYDAGGFGSWGVALKAFNAGGLVLAAIWTCLPILVFVYGHLRLSLAAFLGYAGYAIFTAESFQAEELPDIAERALAAVALTLVVAWIVHPVWDFFRDLLPQPKRRQPAEEEKAGAEENEEQPRPRPEPRRRRGAVDMAAGTEALGPPLPAPVPVAPAPAVRSVDVEAQRPRDRTRLKLELAYVLALPTMGSHFPRDMFDHFINRYVGDHLPPEDVEVNARQVELILAEHQKQAQGALEPLPAEELAQQEESRELDELDLALHSRGLTGFHARN